MTSSNGNIFRVAGPVTSEFPSQRTVMRNFDVFFDMNLNKRLVKRPRRRWFETPVRSLWGHCNACREKERQVDSCHVYHRLLSELPMSQITEVYMQHSKNVGSLVNWLNNSPFVEDTAWSGNWIPEGCIGSTHKSRDMMWQIVIQIKYALPYCVTCLSMSTDPGFLNSGTRRSRVPGWWDPGIRTDTGAGDKVLAKHI